MLRAMALVTQWERLQTELPSDWSEARLALRVATDGDAARAAALLGPLMPGRAGHVVRFYATRRGAGPTPGAVGRGLARLDADGISGQLELVQAREPLSAEAPASGRLHLAEAWDDAVAALPPDWSDLYAEVELASSDHLDPAAVALAPLNPARFGGVPGFRFRCARRFGYGASPGMVRRSLAQLDEREFPGEIRILRALSDTKPVGTQGPVWYLGGKVV
jgi:hypothetical protein